MPGAFDALLEMAAGMGPERAMLFCRPDLASLYAKRVDVRGLPF